MILQGINWIDIVFVILLLGMVYKGSKTGVSGQLIPLLGWHVLIFCSIGYYGVISEALFGSLLQNWTRPISFLVIAVVIFIGVKLVTRIFSAAGSEELSGIERTGGALIAALRAFMLFGIIGILLLLIPVKGMRVSAQGSKTCMAFVGLDAHVYSKMTSILGEDKKKSKEETIKEFLSTTVE